MSRGWAAALDVVIPFHAGDQDSAAALLELLLEVDDGHPVRYHLLYGDDDRTLHIETTLGRFLAARHAELTFGLPPVPFPHHLAADDPNQLEYPGTRARRTPEQKRRIFCWNANVFRCIQRFDRFLILEPDCVILRPRWAAALDAAWHQRDDSQPFLGHLKRGQIQGQLTPTHFAGCSIYDGRTLRTLPLEQMFSQRLENPWWPLRNTPGTANANNAFYGPAWSGYDVSYDYFLFAMWFTHLTGHSDPLRWPLHTLHSREDLILCDFRSSLSVEDVMARHLGRLGVLHGVKDDAVRHEARRRAALGRLGMGLASPVDDSLAAA